MTAQVLSDDEKKSVYDRFGEAGLKGAAGMGGGMGGMGGMEGFSNPFDLFETFFGGGMVGGRKRGAGGGARAGGLMAPHPCCCSCCCCRRGRAPLCCPLKARPMCSQRPCADWCRGASRALLLQGGGGGMGGFGGAARAVRNRPTEGDDVRHDLQVDFLEAVFGCSKEIEIRCVGCVGGVGGGVGKERKRATMLGGCWELGHSACHLQRPAGFGRSLPSLLAWCPVSLSC